MNNIKKYRTERGLTLVELGEQFGITKQRAFSLEKQKLNARNGKKFADFFGVNVFELMGTDVLKVLPKNQEEKDLLLAIVDSIKFSEDELTGLTFGKKLKSLRKNKGWILDDLANLSGVSTVSICSYERGERLPTSSAIFKLSKALEVDVNELFVLAENDRKYLLNKGSEL